MPQTTYSPNANGNAMGLGTGGLGINAQTAPSAYDIFGAQQGQQLANIQANAQMYPAKLQQQRFNQIFPFLQGQLGSMNQNPYTIGGDSGTGPTISTAPVLNAQQVQQQVNTQKSANDQSTAAQTKQMQAGLAGRGVGAQSPLAQALAGGMQGQNLATNTANETQARLGAAQANAGQVLSAQQAQEQQYAARQQENIARAAPYFQQRNILLQALSGLV